MTLNEFVYKIAARVKELANSKMDDLRLINAYGCDNKSQARDKDKHKGRGTIIEEILTEEFIGEIDKEIED